MSPLVTTRFKEPRRKRRAPLRTADRCDQLFSKLVRRHGRCVECGSTRDLECAHGMRRGFRATRWDFRNAFCLCSSCHQRFTVDPPAWELWLVNRLGIEGYSELYHRAHAGIPEPIDATWARLRELERRAS
jgi:hypothetical protein